MEQKIILVVLAVIVVYLLIISFIDLYKAYKIVYARELHKLKIKQVRKNNHLFDYNKEVQ